MGGGRGRKRGRGRSKVGYIRKEIETSQKMPFSLSFLFIFSLFTSADSVKKEEWEERVGGGEEGGEGPTPALSLCYLVQVNRNFIYTPPPPFPPSHHGGYFFLIQQQKWNAINK